jgi:hypothetical protein
MSNSFSDAFTKISHTAEAQLLISGWFKVNLDFIFHRSLGTKNTTRFTYT